MPDCPVCCQEYTDVKRLRLTCAYCAYDGCQECYRTYILSTEQDAHCMQCRQVWSRDVLGGYFPPSWLNGPYKKHREKILLEREKQLLPESQHLVTNYQQAKELRKGMMEKTNALLAMKRSVGELSRQIWNDRYRAERLEYNGFRGLTGASGSNPKKPRTEYVSPCPVEECRGFMDSAMTCGVCQSTACLECGVLLVPETEHECDANVAASFKAIKKQTRPCPKCAVPTFKVSGCNQMWCTACHATWDWNSGDLVTGVIHNPHYFAFLRDRSATGEIPRQPGDVQDGQRNCNRQQFPQGYDLVRKFRSGELDKESPEYHRQLEIVNSMSLLARKLIHIAEVELPGLRHRYRDTDNADLRLRYLVQEISQEDMQVQLQRREKKREKDVAVRDIYQMVCDTSRDALWQYVDGHASVDATMEELTALRTYANDHLKKVREHYKMSAKMI